MSAAGVSVLILTKNEQRDLLGCLESVAWSDDIVVYDSFSDDNTVSMAESLAQELFLVILTIGLLTKLGVTKYRVLESVGFLYRC